MATQASPAEEYKELWKIQRGLKSLRRNIGVAVLMVYLSITFFLTHIDLSNTMLDYRNYPSEFQIVDKIYHFTSYSIMMFLVLFAMTRPEVGGKRKDRVRIASAKRLVMWCVFVVFYGVFDECTQPYFHRSFEVLDLFANFFGIAVGQAAFVIAEASGWRRKVMKLS